MRNLSEVEVRLRDAESSLRSAENNFMLRDWKVTVQNAQLCIELSAKAVIAYFEEPWWTHDPSEQLLSVIEARKEELEALRDVLQRLYALAEDAEMAAPWHAWSTYGRRAEDGSWVPAVELCSEGTAKDILERARRSYETAREFFETICPRDKST